MTVTALVTDQGALISFSAALIWVSPTCSLLTPNPLLMPYLSLLQGVRSWKEDDSPVANGAEPAGHRRRDREPGREERKEEETLKTSQVDNGLRSAARPGLDVAELASVQSAEQSLLEALRGK